MKIIAETPRLFIREFTPDDLETYIGHYKGEEFLRYIPNRTREERELIFGNALTAYGDLTRLNLWGIFNKTYGDLAGVCLLRPFLFDHTKTEVGYSIEEKYWNQGLATEMVLAMVQYAFAQLDNPEMVAIIIPENIASGRVLEKAGFSKIEDWKRDGENLACYKLVNTPD